MTLHHYCRLHCIKPANYSLIPKSCILYLQYGKVGVESLYTFQFPFQNGTMPTLACTCCQCATMAFAPSHHPSSHHNTLPLSHFPTIHPPTIPPSHHHTLPSYTPIIHFHHHTLPSHHPLHHHTIPPSHPPIIILSPSYFFHHHYSIITLSHHHISHHH